MSAPIAEAVLRYAGLGVAPFHTPGHKGGRGAHPLLRRFLTDEGLAADVSLSAELDDLHAPTGCIRAAEDLAAEAYGADAAYFMVNGTTGAVHTMLMAALSPGDTLLVPRNAHRSIVGAMILAGVRPVYLQPEVDTRLGIAMGVSLETVRRAAAAHPEARAALLVYPTYYGVATELGEIAAFLHARGMHGCGTWGTFRIFRCAAAVCDGSRGGSLGREYAQAARFADTDLDAACARRTCP